ncbi:anti-repressor SinI family protein [Evansella sp. AB-P1]|nr:anti-repressor SinI family protein [Evansella sp. AB-P1]MDG5789077.1 anti-repressor SinI family protein [Evansella sp. AB-P1]
MISHIKDTNKELDKEWVELIQRARGMGIPIEDIRKFLSKNKVKS